MAEKEIQGYLKMQVPAGAANPSPPTGPALGQRGVNIMDFCKLFNAKTEDLEKNTPVPVIVKIYVDKSFELTIKTPPASYYLKKAANISKGNGETGRSFVGKVSVDQCRDIAKEKLQDLNTQDIEQATKQIMGSARSMGLEVKGV